MATIDDEIIDARPTPRNNGDRFAHNCPGPIAENCPKPNSIKNNGKPIIRQQIRYGRRNAPEFLIEFFFLFQ